MTIEKFDELIWELMNEGMVEMKLDAQGEMLFVPTVKGCAKIGTPYIHKDDEFQEDLI